MRNFNELFMKNVTYGNVKSHKKVALHPLSRKYIFGKTIRGWSRFDVSVFLGLIANNV